MAKSVGVEVARQVFTKRTAALEDAPIIAAEGQVTSDLMAPRRSCDSLIARLAPRLKQLHRLRRRLG
jgi:hypothetical protein